MRTANRMRIAGQLVPRIAAQLSLQIWLAAIDSEMDGTER